MRTHLSAGFSPIRATLHNPWSAARRSKHLLLNLGIDRQPAPNPYPYWTRFERFFRELSEHKPLILFNRKGYDLDLERTPFDPDLSTRRRESILVFVARQSLDHEGRFASRNKTEPRGQSVDAD